MHIVTMRRTLRGNNGKLPLDGFTLTTRRGHEQKGLMGVLLVNVFVLPTSFFLGWSRIEPKPTLVKPLMLSYQHLSPIHSNSLRKGSLDGERLLRKQKRMEAQTEPSRTAGQYKVCQSMINMTITNSRFSCTTKKNCSCVEPGTRRDPPRSRNQRCHLSTSPKLLLRNPQNHT